MCRNYCPHTIHIVAPFPVSPHFVSRRNEQVFVAAQIVPILPSARCDTPSPGSHAGIRRSIGRNPAWRGDFRQEKGPENLRALLIGGGWMTVQFRLSQLNSNAAGWSGSIGHQASARLARKRATTSATGRTRPASTSRWPSAKMMSSACVSGRSRSYFCFRHWSMKPRRCRSRAPSCTASTMRLLDLILLVFVGRSPKLLDCQRLARFVPALRRRTKPVTAAPLLVVACVVPSPASPVPAA